MKLPAHRAGLVGHIPVNLFVQMGCDRVLPGFRQRTAKAEDRKFKSLRLGLKFEFVSPGCANPRLPKPCAVGRRFRLREAFVSAGVGRDFDIRIWCF
jgi:hypothetical protein